MRWLVIAPLLLAGCPPPDSDLVVVDERFEDPLSQRWIVNGTVDQVETYHPAEHGAVFLTETTMSIETSLNIYSEYQDGTWIEYSTSCGGSPELWNEQVGPTEFHLHLVIPQAVDGTPDEFMRVHANTPALPPLDPTGYGWDVTQLVVHSYDGGSCIIDNLRWVQPEYAW